MRQIHRALALVFAVLWTTHAWADEIHVYAAASLQTALDELKAGFEKQSGEKLILNYGSSATLARQIMAGAPADVYLSANTRWMDAVAKSPGLEPGTRTDLLGNSLVLVVPTGEGSPPLNPAEIAARCDRLAVGETTTVPAGIYARQSLEKLGVWPQVEKKTVPAQDVRAALVYVERGEAGCAVVYSTDAKISSKVRVALTLPPESHDPIVYPAAQLARAQNPSGAKRFLEYLRTETAAGVFEKYGFTFLKP